MKLIFAGISSVQTLDFTSYLFNCTRNFRCQRAFFVPLRQWSDLVLYADLSFGQPDTYSVEIIDACTPNINTVVFNSYVVGQKPDLSYYGVFGGAVPTFDPGESVIKFFLRFTFTKAGVDYIYYTEQFYFEQCDNLMYLQGCYPNEPRGTDAEDCNGIYYGLHSGPDAPLGNSNYRYFHWAYVRMGSIIEQKKRLSFTAFNSKTIYNVKHSAEHLLEFELVPTFYQRVITGLIGIGNIRVDGVDWKLSDEQEFSLIDRDSKLWNVDILLDEQCEMKFGCGPRDCQLPTNDCCDPEVTSATATDPTPFRVENFNQPCSITGIFTAPNPGLPADAREVSVVGGYPIPPNTGRDATIHPDHDGDSNLVVIVYFSCVPCGVTLKVTDSDNVSDCNNAGCLVAVIGAGTAFRLDNAETFRIRVSTDPC